MKKTTKNKEKIDACYCYNAKVRIWEPCVPAEVAAKERVHSTSNPETLLISYSVAFGLSGASFWIDEGDARQPKLHYLLELARKRELRSLAVASLSHIIRAGYNLTELLPFFDSHEVIFRSIEEHMDTSTPISRFKRVYDADREHTPFNMFPKELDEYERAYKAFIVKHVDPYERFKSKESWDSLAEAGRKCVMVDVKKLIQK